MSLHGLSGRWRPATIVVLSIAVSAVTNLATSGFDLGRWKWYLTAGIVILGAGWAYLDASTRSSRPSDDYPLTDVRVTTRRESQADEGTLWMRPRLDPPAIDRTNLRRELESALSSAAMRGSEHVLALVGPGGYGKTFLAIQACDSDSIGAIFPGGLLWVTIGESRYGPDLTATLNDLCEQITGARPTFVEPEQAGFHLGQLLDNRPPTLLVLDDMWREDQLRPFLFGGQKTVRLVTTRLMHVLPLDSTIIRVGEMTIFEARGLVTSRLDSMPQSQTDALLSLTGRWPLLLSILNGALRRASSQGADLQETSNNLVVQLRRDGPATFDPGAERSRNRAVARTIDASLQILPATARRRCLELSIFPEATQVPLDAVTLVWAESGMTEDEAEQLCADLFDLSLIANYDRETKTLGLHGVLREYLRRLLGESEIVACNKSYLRSLARPGLGRSHTKLGAVTHWWEMRQSSYAWKTLSYHLAEAREFLELSALTSDPRWIMAQILRHGVAGIEADLERSETPLAISLRHTIARYSHLLRPIEPEYSVMDVLVSRLQTDEDVKVVVSDYDQQFAHRPRILPRWPLPDLQPALRRAFIGTADQPFSACTITVNGDWVVAVGLDSVGVVWDTKNGQERCRLVGHDSAITSCQVAPDSSWIATGSLDGTVRIWDFDGKVQKVLERQKTPIQSCAISPSGDLIAACGQDGVVRIWDRASGQQRSLLGFRRYPDPEGTVSTCAFMPDGQHLLTGGLDGSIAIWNLRSGKRTISVRGHVGRIRACGTSKDGLVIFTAGDDTLINTWDGRTGEALQTFVGHAGAVNDCTISSDSYWLASASSDGTVRIWDAESGQQAVVLPGHTESVTGCRWDAKHSWLFTCSWDATARLWDPLAHKEEIQKASHTDATTSCVVLNQTTIITASWDGTLQAWDTSTEKCMRVLDGHDDKVGACQVARRRNLLISAGFDGAVKIWDLDSYAESMILAGHEDHVRCAAVAPSEEWIATGGDDQTLRIWDLDSGECLHLLEGHSDRVNACIAAQDNRSVISVGDDGKLIQWDVKSGKVRTVSHLSGVGTSCDLTPNGETLYVGGADGSVHLYEMQGLTYKDAWKGHEGPVTSCASSPNGAWLASTGRDKTLRIWETSDGQLLASMRVDGALLSCRWIGETNNLCATGDGGIYIFSFLPASLEPDGRISE